MANLPPPPLHLLDSVLKTSATIQFESAAKVVKKSFKSGNHDPREKPSLILSSTAEQYRPKDLSSPGHKNLHITHAQVGGGEMPIVPTSMLSVDGGAVRPPSGI